MSAFANQIAKIEKGQLNKLKHGNLNSVRCFQDIDDAMNAYWLTAKYGKIGEIYNIGGNKIISVKGYLRELIKLSKKKIVLKPDPKLLRPQDVSFQMPDVSRFKKDVKWNTKVKFKESVKKLLEDCRNSLKTK